MLLFVKIKYAVHKTWQFCHVFNSGRSPALYEQLAEYNARFQAKNYAA